MILAAAYARKHYKKRKAEKEQKLLEERGQLPEPQDQSKELDLTCLAGKEIARTESEQSNGAIVSAHVVTQRSTERSPSSSSSSNSSVTQALENDPEFKKYMEHQRRVYLEQRAAPPSYHAVMGVSNPHSATCPSTTAHLQSPVQSQYSPTDSNLVSPTTTHCSCHECMSKVQSPVGSGNAQGQGPVEESGVTPAIPEMPAYENMISELPALPTELDTGISNDSRSTSPVGYLSELPGNLPAILPESRNTIAELPSRET